MPPQQKKHVCTYVGCNYSFDRPYRLAQHLLTHDNVKAFICKEPNCRKSYTSKSHLDRHIKSAHKLQEKNVLYSCPTCLKTYSNRQNLKRHIRIRHGLKEPFSCDNCSLEFKKKNQLSAHMYQHTGLKSFSCHLCSQDFITIYERKRHMRFHKTYTCDICSSVFNHWSKYQKHRKVDHIKQNEYICDECGRKFNQRTYMVRHVKIHSGNLNTKSFKCSYEGCERQYSRSTFLRHHIVTKHEKYKLICAICQAGLATKAKLISHMKLHSKTKTEIKQRKRRVMTKERKDKGSLKVSTAMKIAGMEINPDAVMETELCNDERSSVSSQPEDISRMKVAGPATLPNAVQETPASNSSNSSEMGVTEICNEKKLCSTLNTEGLLSPKESTAIKINTVTNEPIT